MGIPAFCRLLHLQAARKFFILTCCVFLQLLTVQAQKASPSLQSIVDLKGDSITLFQIFRSIKTQTGLSFFYSNQLLDDKERISISLQHAHVSDVLDFILKGRNVAYQLRGDRILLNEKPAVPAKKEEASPVGAGPGHDSIQLKGLVMDVDGKPLPGASIMLKGKERGGVITDELGIFSLNAVVGNVLSISMVGMQPQELSVNGKNNLKVTMTAKTNQLNEVVVVGFGQQKKITVTGAVATVNMSDMKTPVPSLTNALAGKVAGIISVQSSGEPGYDNSTFTIRGIGTFTGNSTPLIIVDGVQRDDVNSTYGGAFNNIDPEDISSISLLKDASSTAMYGAKGANGVLIITTKRGVAGKPKISLKAETGITGFTQRPKMLNGVQYMQLYNEARENMGLSDGYSQEQIQKTTSGLDPYLNPNVDWINTVYKKYSSLTNANLNISGGGESVRYFASASFYDQAGPYRVANISGYNPNLDYKRYDFRTNLDINVTKTTLLQMNLDAMLVNSRYPGISAANLWYISYATTPVAFPVRYPDGKWAGPVNNGGSNPFNEVQNNGYSTEFHPTVQSVFTLNQKLDFLTRGLSAYGRFSFDSYGTFNNSRTGKNDLYFASGRDVDGNLVYTQTRYGQQFLDYSQSATGERTLYLEGNIGYDRSFGPHHIGAMALVNSRNRITSTADNVIKSIPYRNQSLAGRLTYAFNEKYLAEVNAGYTGSENFEPGHKFGFFPSISGGWVISREDFFDRFSGTVSLLKLRGSYGVVGNDNIGTSGRFPYLTQISGGNTTGFGLNGNTVTGQTETVIGVENLTWEKSYKTDIGLELGILNKFTLTADVYHERRKNILIQRQSVSSIAGYTGSSVYANLGEMNNQGMDAQLEYNDKFGKVGLRLYGNVTYAHNKIVFQDEPQRKYAYQRGTGHMYGEFTGYVSEGLFVDQSDIDKRPAQQFGNVQPGDIKYQNLNSADDNIVDAYDWKYMGKSWFPSWLYGAGFTVSYHNFDVSALFQGITDVGIMANGSGILGTTSSGSWGVDGVGVVPFSGIGQYANNTLSKVLDRWTPSNPRQDAYYPRLSVASQADNNYLNSTRWLKSGAYCRLKQASVGYNFTGKSMQKAGLSSMYFYVSGQNLLTFSKFKVWDPEMGSNGAKYPITRMFTCGVRAQF